VVAALQASGPIRGDLLPGRTNAITFADLYRIVPLGADPTATNPADPNKIPGFPLVRVNLFTAELRGAIEGTLQFSMLDGDFFVAPSGLVVEYDLTRSPFDKAATCGLPAAGLCPGWVTRMALVDDTGTETPLYDVSLPFPHFAVVPTTLQPVVTTFYVASVASSPTVGLTLRDDAGVALTPVGLAGAIIRRGDGSAVKDHESLATYVWDECAANGGFLPSRYDATTTEGTLPRRMIDCTGGCP